jgi:hypothetical protein
MDATAAVTPPTSLSRKDTSERTIQRARVAAWALWATALLFAGVAFLLILATFSVDVPSRGYGFRGWVPTVAVLWATIGARIAARQPRNRVGWLVLACGWLWSVNAMFEEYSTFAYYPQELGLPFVEGMVWFDGLVGTLVAGLSALAMLVVPNGRLPSRRWTVVAVGTIVVTAGAVLVLATLPRRLVPFPFDNPFGIEGLRAYESAFPTILRSVDLARGLCVLIPTAALLSRLRRARGDGRQQLKWVAAPAVFASFAVFLYAFVGHPLVEYATLLGLLLVPIGFGIAMRRYRLYEIDRILNRTIVLGSATALLAGLYTASIGLMQRIFILLTGERSDAAVVLTTLLVAAAFAPLRDRVEAFVKRNFGADVPGTRGLDVFTQEIEDHLRLSDREGLLSRLLDETVGSLGAVSGALEIAGAGPRAPMRTVGNWNGNTHLAAEVRDGDRVIARILLGPRANGAEYDAARQVRFTRAVEVVGKALDRIPKGDGQI